jgi:hypothetical protein
VGQVFTGTANYGMLFQLSSLSTVFSKTAGLSQETKDVRPIIKKYVPAQIKDVLFF